MKKNPQIVVLSSGAMLCATGSKCIALRICSALIIALALGSVEPQGQAQTAPVPPARNSSLPISPASLATLPPDLAAALANPENYPAEVTLQKETTLHRRAESGRIIGNSQLPAGTTLTLARVQGTNLYLLATLASAEGQVPALDTDFVVRTIAMRAERQALVKKRLRQELLALITPGLTRNTNAEPGILPLPAPISALNSTPSSSGNAIDTALRIDTAKDPIPETFFGILSPRDNSPLNAPTLKFGTLLIDRESSWPQIESREGRFDFTLTDSLVADAIRAGAEPILTLSGIPNWAEPPGTPANSLYTAPVDPTEWDHYVRALAERYRGRVRYFSIWPTKAADFSGTQREMIALCDRTYATLKSISSSNLVLNGGDLSSTGPLSPAKFLESGGRNSCDILLLSYLGRPSGPDIMALQKNITSLQRDAGLRSTPAWLCIPTLPPPNPANNPRAELFHFLLASWNLGFSRVILPSRPPIRSEFALLDANSSITPLATAYRAIRERLLGCSITTKLDTERRGLSTLDLRLAGTMRIIRLYWCNEGGAEAILSAGSKVTDLMGQPIEIERNRTTVHLEPIFVER